jgi:hypothetical protein
VSDEGFPTAEVFVAILMFWFIVGLAGSALGYLISQPLVRESPPPRFPRLRPWHVGAGVVGIEVVLVGVLAALS